MAAPKGVTSGPGHATQREQGPSGPFAPHWCPLLPAVPSSTPANRAEPLQLATGATAEADESCTALDTIIAVSDSNLTRSFSSGTYPSYMESQVLRRSVTQQGPCHGQCDSAFYARSDWPRFYNRVYTSKVILIRSHDQTARKYPAPVCVRVCVCTRAH